MLRVPFNEMVTILESALKKKNFATEDAHLGATLFAKNSLDGVHTHGLNRFPRVLEYCDKGLIVPDAKMERIAVIGALEQWDAHLGLGPLTARRSMDRAMELAKEHGVGCVAQRNSNHWMRGGAYGWQAVEAGYAAICWTNTQPNMPAWGAKDRRLGNNPLVLAVPRSAGHIVIDAAMSQFSYGKIEEYRLKGAQLPVPGGFDKNGALTVVPEDIEETWRVLPMGFWKGAGFSLVLDLFAATLSGGFTTSEIGGLGGDEYSLSQVFIAFDPYRFESRETIDARLDHAIEDLHGSLQEKANTRAAYPGERVLNTRKENLALGIPVVESIWKQIVTFAK
jgi:3-dehydro-L-gulonate 2-dehydrogenase